MKVADFVLWIHFVLYTISGNLDCINNKLCLFTNSLEHLAHVCHEQPRPRLFFEDYIFKLLLKIFTDTDLRLSSKEIVNTVCDVKCHLVQWNDLQKSHVLKWNRDMKPWRSNQTKTTVTVTICVTAEQLFQLNINIFENQFMIKGKAAKYIEDKNGCTVWYWKRLCSQWGQYDLTNL